MRDAGTLREAAAEFAGGPEVLGLPGDEVAESAGVPVDVEAGPGGGGGAG